MRADDDVTYLAPKTRVTAPNGCVAEGECVAMDGRIEHDRVCRTNIDLVRAGADRWEFASAEAS